MKATTLTLLGAAAGGLLAASAQAQTTTVNQGDLILTMRLTAGGAQEFQMDLGSASIYGSVSPNTTLIIAGFAQSDLNSLFGSGWYSSPSLSWSIVGSSGSFGAAGQPPYTLWASAAESSPGSPGLNPWARQSLNAQAGTDSSIQGLYNGFAGLPLAASANSTMQADANPLSFYNASQDVNGAVGTFGAFYPSIEGLPSQVLDLYQMAFGTRAGGTIGQPGAWVGSFYFDPATQALTYTTVPEPGAPVLGLVGGLLALVWRWRSGRRQPEVGIN